MSDLRERVVAYNVEIKNALQTIIDALNQGQRKKLLRNATVAAMLKRYGVDVGDGDGR